MGGEILVSLLVSGVLWNEMEIFSADNEGTVHLGGNDGACQDTTTDGNETSEWALLVCYDPTLASCSTLNSATRGVAVVPSLRPPCRARVEDQLSVTVNPYPISQILNPRSLHTDVGSLNSSLGCPKS